MAAPDIPNPFSQSIVNDAWQPAPADVPGIHAAAFELCCSALDQVRRGEGSRSVLLHGLPGSGKTHLLARLRSHWVGQASGETAPSRPPGSPQVLLTSVRLRAGARMVCRYLRRTMAGDLFRPTPEGFTQLERLLLHRLSRYFPNQKKIWRWWQAMREPLKERKWWEAFGQSEDLLHLEGYFDRLMERLDEEADLGRNLAIALRHVVSGRRRRDVREWLREGMLPEAVMEELGLVNSPADEDPEEEAIAFICALSRLAGPDIPLVLCFDQVEALQTHPQDMEGLFAFGRMISALHDKTRSFLLITCVQTAFLDRIREAVRGADMDRLAEREGLLKPLTWREAQALAEARLENSPDLAEQRAARDHPLWPLQVERLQHFVQSAGACTPRQLISFCDDEFEQWRQGEIEPLLSREDYLVQQYQALLKASLEKGAPRHTDEILAHGLPLLVETLGQGRQAAGRTPRGVDFVFHTPSGERYVSLCNQNGILLTMRLKRLHDQVKRGELTHLALIRDSRLPISKQAIRAWDYLDALLRQREVVMVRPTAFVLAALDACRGLLSDAMAGDLAHHGESISAEMVQEWMRAYLPGLLADLLLAILPEGQSAAGGEEMYDELLEFVQQNRLTRLTEAAQALGRSVEELEDCLSRYPGQFGVLQGPPKVVFDLAFAGVEE